MLYRCVLNITSNNDTNIPIYKPFMISKITTPQKVTAKATFEHSKFGNCLFLKF
jgi:hypothetical protein